MLEYYDHNLHHVDARELARIVIDFKDSIEIAAAYSSLWSEGIEAYLNDLLLYDPELKALTNMGIEGTREEKLETYRIRLYMEAISSFPYDENNLYEVLGKFAPDLRDQH